MTPLKPILMAALLLTACSASSTPSVPRETPFQVSITVHCGVEWQIFEFEGAMYRVQARNAAERESPPRGWPDPAVITVIEEDGRLLAIGPDGSERSLIRVPPGETSDACF